MFFAEDDISFSLEAILLKSAEVLNSGLWLVLTGINEIPPHIALISDGKYYSVSARKVDCGSDLSRFINTLERKKVPTLFVGINCHSESAEPEEESQSSRGCFIPIAIGTFNMTNSLQAIYKELKPLKNTERTCLAPIRSFFAAYFSPEYIRVNYVFELLTIAEKQGLIKGALFIFAEGANANRITLQKYTMQQIKDKIHSLSAQITALNP